MNTTGTRTINLKLLAVIAVALLVGKVTSSRVPWWASVLIVLDIVVAIVTTCHAKKIASSDDAAL